SIADGELLVLVGPSGCGKSTVLRMIAGLEEVSEGEIRIGPRVVNDIAPKDRDIAMVFQSYALYPHMTVLDNMAFGLRRPKTHDQIEAMTLGDRIAVLRAGVLQQVADPFTLYQRPANQFVAGFIGSPPINFFGAGVSAPNAAPALEVNGIAILLPAEFAARLEGRRGKRVTV